MICCGFVALGGVYCPCKRKNNKKESSENRKRKVKEKDERV